MWRSLEHHDNPAAVTRLHLHVKILNHAARESQYRNGPDHRVLIVVILGDQQAPGGAGSAATGTEATLRSIPTLLQFPARRSLIDRVNPILNLQFLRLTCALPTASLGILPPHAYRRDWNDGWRSCAVPPDTHRTAY